MISKDGGPDAAEVAHLDAFHAARPDWAMGIVSPRVYDESLEIDAHRYPHAVPYQTGMKYVLDRVIPHLPARILDIGSPLTQNIALAAMPGADLTIADCREHPDAAILGLRWRVANATALPFDDGAFPIVTSCWVMGHVGDGRYGDPLDVDGDKRMLREMRRVCSGFAIVGVGLIDEQCSTMFNMHRIYSWQWLAAAMGECGWRIMESVNLPVKDDYYFGSEFIDRKAVQRTNGFYGICTLERA